MALVEKGNSEIESTSFDLDLDESVELNDENLENEIKKTIIDVKTLPIEQAKDVINGELAPNTIYSMGNGNLYESDDKGRVVKKEFIPFIVEDKRSFEDSKNTSEVGKLGKEGDHGGHIQAHSLGGTSDKINLFPQNGNFNMEEYKTIENGIRDDLRKGNAVNVTVELIYNNASSRPDQVRVTKVVVDVNGNTNITAITRKNAPREAQYA